MEAAFLRFEGLTHRFSNGKEALSGIDLVLGSEGLCVIAGANGSGKTALMRHSIGLLAPTSGKVLFRGKDLRKCLRVARRSIGLVFQDADNQFVGDSVLDDARFGLENLGLPAREVEERSEAALREAGLWEKREHGPRQLSGGEKRKLAIAGVIAMGAEMLILDEPFANLDYPSIKVLLGEIERVKAAGKAVVVLTHELEKVLAHADRLVILAEGRLVHDGVPADIARLDLESWAIRTPLCSYKTLEDLTWMR